MPKVLMLSTYPIKKPLHGGQRRVSALKNYYLSKGWIVDTIAIYDANSFSNDLAEANDIPLEIPDQLHFESALYSDLVIGERSAKDPFFQKILHTVLKLKPDMVLIEQPFLLPVAERLMLELPSITKIVYSSQNVEAPLKASLLKNFGLPKRTIDDIENRIAKLEKRACEVSSTVITVSESDAAFYKNYTTKEKIVVVKNGVNRYGGQQSKSIILDNIFKKEYAYFVGSAYPPNIEGFNKYVTEGGCYYLPPEKMIVVCGSVSDPIYASTEYLNHAPANGDRLHFFSEISDDDLYYIIQNAACCLLPIETGGGSNLKTSEALANGKRLIATPTAMRGFDEFIEDPGVTIVKTPKEFRREILNSLSNPVVDIPKIWLNKRQELFWDNLLEKSGLDNHILSS